MNTNSKPAELDVLLTFWQNFQPQCSSRFGSRHSKAVEHPSRFDVRRYWCMKTPSVSENKSDTKRMTDILASYPIDILFVLTESTVFETLWIGFKQLSLLSSRARNLSTFERLREAPSLDSWVGCVCLASNVIGRSGTTVILLVINFLRRSSEKFKSATWSGHKCRAPGDNDTWDLSLHI